MFVANSEEKFLLPFITVLTSYFMRIIYTVSDIPGAI